MFGKVVCMKEKVVVRGKMQDAEDETKDYSVKETKGEQGGEDEVGGEQRRSVSFIAHSRPLREGLTSQGLRGKLVVLSCASSLVGCLASLAIWRCR